MNNKQTALTAEEFIQIKVRETYNYKSGLSLNAMAVRGEHAMLWAKEYADQQTSSLIEENKRLRGKSLEEVSVHNYLNGKETRHYYVNKKKFRIYTEGFTPEQLRAIANHIESLTK